MIARRHQKIFTRFVSRGENHTTGGALTRLRRRPSGSRTIVYLRAYIRVCRAVRNIFSPALHYRATTTRPVWQAGGCTRASSQSARRRRGQRKSDNSILLLSRWGLTVAVTGFSPARDSRLLLACLINVSRKRRGTHQACIKTRKRMK